MEILEFIKTLWSNIALIAKEWGDMFIAAGALILSLISYFKASKAETLQNQINELELKIKEYELEKIKKEQDEANSSCVEARVTKISSGKYRMKVWNSGNTPVYNVTAKFEGDPQIFIFDRDKQPFDILESRKNYELSLATHMGSASKFVIITEWTDEQGQLHTKRQMGDL